VAFYLDFDGSVVFSSQLTVNSGLFNDGF